MVRAMKQQDRETRDALLQFLRILFFSSLRLTVGDLQEETAGLLRGGERQVETPENAEGKKGGTGA